MLWSFGVGEVPISMSGDPADATRLVYTIRSVGQASRALVTARPGASVGVRGPFGTGWPVDAARGRDVIIMAGGIGLAPLRPVDLSGAAQSKRIWQAHHPLRNAPPARSAVPQRAGRMGAAARDRKS